MSPEIDLHSTTDARVWAQEWCRIARDIEATDDDRRVIDEGWMIAWFANAIMAGYDEARRRYEMTNAHEARMRSLR